MIPFDVSAADEPSARARAIIVNVRVRDVHGPQSRREPFTCIIVFAAHEGIAPRSFAS